MLRIGSKVRILDGDTPTGIINPIGTIVNGGNDPKVGKFYHIMFDCGKHGVVFRDYLADNVVETSTRVAPEEECMRWARHIGY